MLVDTIARGGARLLLAGALLVTGCQPKIGDPCGTATDCSTLNDRLCDTSQPDGYCTEFNCEPDECDDEATCVAFQAELDQACKTVDDGSYGRFGRTFCMRKCGGEGDCRPGYECVAPIERAARVVDTETDADTPQEQKICLAIGSAPQVPSEPPSACYPNTPHELPPPYQGTGEGGMGGSGGAGGMGGMGGAGGAGTGGAGGAGTGGSGTGGTGTGGSGMGGSGGA
ncbi:MAG: hypothetical protein R3B72_08495 [Polyangiaceae bacterium]